ncbi:hypothetical protein Tco_0180881 [Tanacetum coccineum]
MSLYNIPHGLTSNSSCSACPKIPYHWEMQHICGASEYFMTISKVPNTEDTIKFMLDTENFTYNVDSFRDTLHLLVGTLKNPFVAPVIIQTIEAFMNRVGYQGCDYAALLWWDFMNNVFQNKEAIRYPRFIKLIIDDLMKKFPNIPQKINEDYHSIKDNIPLVSDTTGNLLVRRMLIPNEFLTEEIRATDDLKEYEKVFMNVAIPMNQPQPGKKRKQTTGESSSSRKSHKITIKKKKQSTTLIPPPGDDRERDEVAEATIISFTLHKTTLAAEAQENIAKVPEKLDEDETEKLIECDEDEESFVSEFADSMINEDVDDFSTRIEPGSHKEHPENVNNDDEEIEKEETNDDVEKTDEVVKEKDNDEGASGSMKFRNMKEAGVRDVSMNPLASIDLQHRRINLHFKDRMHMNLLDGFTDCTSPLTLPKVSKQPTLGLVFGALDFSTRRLELTATYSILTITELDWIERDGDGALESQYRVFYQKVRVGSTYDTPTSWVQLVNFLHRFNPCRISHGFFDVLWFGSTHDVLLSNDVLKDVVDRMYACLTSQHIKKMSPLGLFECSMDGISATPVVKVLKWCCVVDVCIMCISLQWVSDYELEAPKEASQFPEQAPPSPDYVPGPEHPPSPDYVPGPEHPPSPDYVPSPEVPDCYIADSDPEEDPHDDLEEDHADYPADGGDEKEEEESYEDDADDEDDDEASKEEEDGDEEEEEHLASADTSTIPIDDPVSSAEDKRHLRQTDLSMLSAPTPPSPPLSILTLLSSPLPQISSPPLPLPSPTHTSPTYSEALLGYRATMIRSRATLTLPLTAPHYLCYSLLLTVAVRREVGYGITNVSDDMVRDMEGRAPTTLKELSQRVTDLAATLARDTHDMYVHIEDAQDDQALLRA